MVLYHTVSPQDATGKVRQVYEDIKETKGIDFVPNFWQALANNPDHLESTWQKLKTVMKPGKLDLLTKEIIALAVSITNNCTYGICSHSAAVKRLGLDNEAVAEVIAVVDVFSGTNSLANAYQVEPDVIPDPDGRVYKSKLSDFFAERCADLNAGYLWKRFSAGLTDYNCFYIQQKLLAGLAFADNHEDEQPFGATNVIIELTDNDIELQVFKGWFPAPERRPQAQPMHRGRYTPKFSSSHRPSVEFLNG